MLSKRHYVAIASIANVALKSSVDGRKYANDPVVVSFAENLARYFASDNPRFDRERFLAACGVNDDA
jgi:hypothetical protein